MRRDNEIRQDPWPRGTSPPTPTPPPLHSSVGKALRMPIGRAETSHSRVSICVRALGGSDPSLSLRALSTWCPAPTSGLFPLFLRKYCSACVYAQSPTASKSPHLRGALLGQSTTLASHTSNLPPSVSPHPDWFFVTFSYMAEYYIFISPSSLSHNNESSRRAQTRSYLIHCRTTSAQNRVQHIVVTH